MPEQRLDCGEQTDLSLEIAYLLFIDVVGYSKLLVNEQIEVMEHLKQVVRSTDCFRDANANEKIILPTGDGMALLFFRSPEQPARCALQIARALSPQVKVRMGIHSGPVNRVLDVNDQLNIAGAGMNITQRIMDCGDAGHILLSKHVADDLANYRHWHPYLHDLGQCEVKHGLNLHIFNFHTDEAGNAAIPEKLKRSGKKIGRGSKTGMLGWLTISGLILALLAIGAWFIRGAVISPFAPAHTGLHALAPPVAKSVALLPFDNRSEEKTNAYLAESIQDEILTKLSKIADLKVISRASTQHYHSAPENLADIAHQLGVAYVVEGSVQKSGQAVRINVQLIKAATDSHVWAETFDRTLTDIFSVETEVARAIADQLQARLSGAEEKALAAKPTNDPEAYDAYLRGLAYTLKTLPTTANVLAAQKYLKEAVRLDPKFALSWALLSVVDSRSYLTQSLPATEALRDEARQAAEIALDLQPNLGEAIWAKGFYHYACLRDYETALRYLERARELLPNDSRIPESLGYVARRRGRWEQSQNYLEKAERLDPRNVSILTGLATNYMCMRHFPEASRKLEQILNITPEDVDTLALKASIAQAEGDLQGSAGILAPLHPGADDSGALEIQVYQAILERRPAPMIARLKEIVGKADGSPGYVNGELLFWLGWAQEVAGDGAGARSSWEQARVLLTPLLQEQPGNYSIISDLALVEMALNNKASAFALAERARAADPVEKDAVRGPFMIEVLARIAARMGEPDRAITALETLLNVPYHGAMAAGAPLTPALLRLDPMFDALRSNPRFQTLVTPSAAR